MENTTPKYLKPKKKKKGKDSTSGFNKFLQVGGFGLTGAALKHFLDNDKKR